MTLSENSSGSSQLEGLLDLLVDLQLVNQPQDSTEESPLPKGDAKSQEGGFSSQLMEDAEDLATKASSVLETKSQIEEVKEKPSPMEALVGTEFDPSQNIDPGNGAKTGESSSSSLPPLSRSSSSISSHPNLAADKSLRAVEGLQNLLSQPQQPEKPQPQSTKQPLPSEENWNQPKNLDASSEQVFNQLIQSQWQKKQPKQFTNQSIAAANEQDVENSIELFERWQRLLLTQEVMGSREAIAKFKDKLASLEHQLHEPSELTNLILPLITEILTLKVAQEGEDVASAIAPIIDEMIVQRTQQNKTAMSSALAPVLADAVAQQASNSPGDLAKALGPEMGPAIKEQISLERDAMVDALYPVIGSTISKYMAEVVRSINEKVENTLSFEGISRKIRAKIQGISEAELIFREAMPFTIQAIFLIHKGSGLVISEMQPLDRQHLESEMVAGMLTAIRSFVNDCIVQAGDVSEIDQIEYGNSKIILEVAGYCYLAAVTQGQPPKSFIQEMRHTLATIVQNHGKAIELFDGDPSHVPEQVYQLLQDLTRDSNISTENQTHKQPVALLIISLVVLSTISLSLGIYQYRSWVNHQAERETSFALESDPELAVYRIAVEANHKSLKLFGRLPNQYLRSKAEQIAKKVEPKLKINNAIIPVEVPPDPVSAQAEVKRVANILNQIEGAVISADYNQGKVAVQGTVLQEGDAQKITQAFQQIPGVKSVTSTVQLQPLAIASRVYFEQGASEIKPDERSKIAQIKAFLDQYPNKYLKLLGHTDPRGTAAENQSLALERATKVKDALVTQGVDSHRLQAVGTIDPPLGVNAEQIPLLSRCVEFQIITP